MISRKMLDEMFGHLYAARAKLEQLNTADTFQCCEVCNESPSYQAHIAEIRYLEEKIKLLNLLIDVYIVEQ